MNHATTTININSKPRPRCFYRHRLGWQDSRDLPPGRWWIASKTPRSRTFTREALNRWVGELHQRFGDGPIGVCLEQSKGSLINFLICHDLFVLYPINPKTLAKFREAFRPSGAKDDPDDADIVPLLARQCALWWTSISEIFAKERGRGIEVYLRTSNMIIIAPKSIPLTLIYISIINLVNPIPVE